MKSNINPHHKPKLMFGLMLLLLFSMGQIAAQDPLNRSVQVSLTAQENPPKFDFQWEWDWSGGGYNVYRKTPDEPAWGNPIASLPWGSTAFTDENVAVGVPYEYAFFKKEFENIVDTVQVPSGATLTFTFKNIYGDGICCNFGFGWYLVRVCDETVSGGSDFGFEKSETFTVCNNGNPTEPLVITIHPDMQVNNSWWTLTDQTGNVLATSGPQGTLLDERPKYGYILAGMKLPAVEYRGSILLLVDDVYSAPLAVEVAQLERDLIGDGWKVIRREVNRNSPVTAVKSLIVNVYNQTPDLKMLYLLGHVPVPYSGNIYPDGHKENHWGAWAADVYYGDVDGVWTDATVTNTTAQFAYNHNVPGDGKFDQSAIPGGICSSSGSCVELAVGRVDLFNMPAFGLNDVELTRRYLNKAHLFKTGQRSVERRALVDDNLNIVLASPAASGWRNFAPMFHHENVVALDYFTTMKNESYLWSYGCGSGTHTSANGIGTTQDFANDTLKNIFTMLCGSQFGDWDNTNNFLRAPLASPGWTLTSCWAGNPPFTFHRLAMGEPIGFSLLRTQNSSQNDYYPGPQLVHTALMGDPSLRLHPVKPPTGLILQTGVNSVNLQWTAPVGETVAGYHVYRADSLHGHFTKINTSLVTSTTFTDFSPPADSAVYMVRTVKLETSGSGTYWNLSLGTISAGAGSPCAGVPSETAIFPEICWGEGFEIGGLTYSQSGIYESLFTTAAGCDSLVVVHLSVLPSVQATLDTNFWMSIELFGQIYDYDTTFTVVLQAANGCDSILTVNLTIINGTDEQAGKQMVALYPNPASGVVFLEMKNGIGQADVEMMDGMGRQLLFQKIKPSGHTELDVSGLPSGIYFLRIKYGNQCFFKKLVLD